MMKLEEFGHQMLQSALSRFLHGGTITILVRAKPPFPLYQCGLNVFPVSSNVFSRERIRGHPSAQAA